MTDILERLTRVPSAANNREAAGEILRLRSLLVRIASAARKSDGGFARWVDDMIEEPLPRVPPQGRRSKGVPA